MIKLAHDAGADAVKLQSWTAERYASAQDPERLERVRTFGLSLAEHDRLFTFAEASGIVLFSTSVSEDWVPYLFERAPAIKIASGDLTFDPLLETIAAQSKSTGKPVILSTGMATVDEIDHAVGIFRTVLGDDHNVAHHLALMHCIAGYPTPLDQANLRTIPFLRQRYGVSVGWSNHVMGSAACIAAATLGAELIEVHVTDSREGKTFRDHHPSMIPEELKQLVDDIGSLASSGLGTSGKAVALVEIENHTLARKGIIASRDLEVGQVLERDDLMFARPATEFVSSELGWLLGKSLTQAVKKGHLIPRRSI